MRWRKALSCAAERVKPTVIVLNSHADHYDLLVLLLSNRYGSAAMSLHFQLARGCIATKWPGKQAGLCVAYDQATRKACRRC